VCPKRRIESARLPMHVQGMDRAMGKRFLGRSHHEALGTLTPETSSSPNSPPRARTIDHSVPLSPLDGGCPCRSAKFVHFDKQGKIVSGSCYYDQYTLLTQLGHTAPLAEVA
jgi:hypothetical protein